MKRVSVALAGLAILAFGFAHAAEQQRGANRYGVSEVCRDLDFYESLKPTVPVLLRLNQKQVESWRGVEAALVDARRPIDTGCGKLKVMPATSAANAQAARLEVALSSSLDALRRVRPAFDRFYGALDDGQRRQVDKMFENSQL